jgi:protein pelota
MRLISKTLDKDASGSVQLVAQEPEDMWHTYNLLNKGDLLLCSTLRQVVSETATGSTDKSSVRLWLTISVESIFFDTQVCILRVNGRNAQENKYVKVLISRTSVPWTGRTSYKWLH